MAYVLYLVIKIQIGTVVVVAQQCAVLQVQHANMLMVACNPPGTSSCYRFLETKL
jgi:hypothetical protein